jgi:hypothetical protein
VLAWYARSVDYALSKRGFFWRQEGIETMADELNEIDLLSAIWILASIDENHLLTYEGIRERLGLNDEYNVRELILRRRELFRPGAPPGALEKWKTKMRERPTSQPAWIRAIHDESQKLAAIEQLSENDVFRSQFRARMESPRSEVELLNWGLEHLDRIRASRLASREAHAKSWQMWLVFGIGVVNVVVTILVPYFKGEYKPKPPADDAACVSGDSKPSRISRASE